MFLILSGIINKMKIIDKQTAGDWCLRHGIRLNNDGLPNVKGTSYASEFSIPTDAGKRTSIVKEQMNNLFIDVSCLVWLDDWNVWPSGQWQHVFDRFRLSYGCNQSLIEKPAHEIEKSEYDIAISIAVYAVLMLWDCYVISDVGLWIYYSHDEYGLVNTQGEQSHAANGI